MPGRLCLIDSHVLIRWVQPEASEFRVVVRAIRWLEDTDDTPCYTSQNLGEFWNCLLYTSEGSAALAQALESGQITPIKMDQVLHPNSNKPPFPYVVKAKAGHTRAAGATGPFILVYFSHQPALRNLDSKAIGAEVDAAFQPYGGKIAFKACLLKLQ